MDAGLDGKRIFITGGTGFLGSLVLRSLCRLAAERKSEISVTVLSRNPAAFCKARPELLWPGLTFLKGDIGSFHFESGSRFDYVLHGGNPSEVPSDGVAQQMFKKTVVEGTNHLLAELDRLEKLPARILLLSSGAVYGPQPQDLSAFPENFSLKSGSTYADAKLTAEVAMKLYAAKRGIGLTIGRIFACAGPYVPLEGRFALGQFIRSARDKGEIRIQSDGTPKRSYLAGDELAEWLLTLLSSGDTNIEVFNIGSDDVLSILEVAEAIRENFISRGKTVSIVLDSAHASRGTELAPNYIPDIRLIEKKYGLKPRKSSVEAIRETTEWVLDKR